MRPASGALGWLALRLLARRSRRRIRLQGGGTGSAGQRPAASRALDSRFVRGRGGGEGARTRLRAGGVCQRIAAASGDAVSARHRSEHGDQPGAPRVRLRGARSPSRRRSPMRQRRMRCGDRAESARRPGDDIVFRQECGRDGPTGHRHSLMPHTQSVQRAPSPAPPGQPARGFSRRVQTSLRRSRAQTHLGHRWETEGLRGLPERSRPDELQGPRSIWADASRYLATAPVQRSPEARPLHHPVAIPHMDKIRIRHLSKAHAYYLFRIDVTVITRPTRYCLNHIIL